MSENEASRRMQQQVERELAEANDPRNAYQKVLDNWWQSERDLAEEESDWVTIGGFRERKSATPSFHRGRRDPDWRVR